MMTTRRYVHVPYVDLPVGIHVTYGTYQDMLQVDSMTILSNVCIPRSP